MLSSVNFSSLSALHQHRSRNDGPTKNGQSVSRSRRRVDSFFFFVIAAAAAIS